MLSDLIDRYFIKQPRLRRFVTRLIAGNKPEKVFLFGSHLTVHPQLENGYWRAAHLAEGSSLFRDELPVFLALSNFAAPGRTFVDAGANVGIFSVAMARFTHLYRDFRVTAFEVAPDTFVRLQANAKDHAFAAFPFGLAERNTTASFTTGAVSHVATRADLASAYHIPGEGFSAELRRLDSFDLPGDLVIKVDVEGQELAVLRGASRFFDEGRVAAVYLDGYRDAACWDFLESRGFRLFDGRSLEPADRDTYALLAVRPEQR